MAHCSELNSVPSWYTTHNTQWTNKRMNERMNEEGWGEKNKQRKWPSQLLCASFAPIFCWFLSLSVSGFLFGSVLFDSILFIPHTVRGILSHYSVFNRTFNLFRCRSNSLLYSNLIFTSYLADLVEWKDSQSEWMNKRTFCNLLLSVSSFIFANCFDNYGENEAKCFRMNYSN